MKFYATCGLGLEPFFLTELTSSPHFQVSEPLDYRGKIFFTNTTEKISEIFKFRSIERIFGTISTKFDLDDLPTSSLSPSYLSNTFFRDNPDLIDTLKTCHKLKVQGGDPEDPEDSTPPGGKKRRVENDQFMLKFRVCPKITGKYRDTVNGRQVSKFIGSTIVQRMSGEPRKWGVDPRDPEVEVSIHISEAGVVAGVPLTTDPLSLRPYLRHIPLRSTVGYAMASLVFQNDSSRSLVVDPMCGSGVILLEAVKCFPKAVGVLLGVDNDPGQLKKALENVTKAGETRIDIIQGDSKKLEEILSQNMRADAIICDMPFGGKFGDVKGVVEGLPVLLRSFDTVLNEGGVAVLLMSLQLSMKVEEVAGEIGWKLKDKYPLRLGELNSVIFHFVK